MVKKITGLGITIILIVLIYFLNKPIHMGNSDIPALGMFLSPTHGFWKSTSNTGIRNQTLEFKCVKGNATVVYDEIGVPHIFADNEEDLMYAQGYVEAKDRLWQMEFQMYAAAGRLTELVGEKALSLDRFSRRIGLVRAAKSSLVEIEKNPVSKMIVDNFTAGVNAYIHQLKKSEIPVEYKLIGYTPEDWTPLKCALLMKYMAKDLTYYDVDVENTNALRKFGEEAYKKMYPDFPVGLDPIIPKGTKWNFKSVDSFSLKNPIPNKNNQAVLYKNPYKQFYSNPNYGSNNWCINGSKTSSGKPILCGDPHLGLNLPSIWYEVQLSCPGLNVYGVTIPGAPGVIIGHNDSIAWSVTNSERDVINNYSVEYNTDKTSYKLGNEFIPFDYDEEVYKIKNGKDFNEKIKITKVGAVVYDENFGETNDKKHLATYWRAEEPSNDLMAFYYLNKAKNHQDYLNALNYYACPGQNFIYADASNNIAIRQQGNFMLRTNYGDGSFVTPLADVNIAKLKARIPNEQNPYILNPARNFCASANQNPVDENYPYYTNGHYENYRNRVINETLTNATNYTWKDMAKLHSNNLSLLAKETLPTILADLTNVPNDAMSNKIIATLKTWNYYADANSEAPTFFYKLSEEIEKITYDEMTTDKTSYRLPEPYNTANLLVNDPTFIIFDIQNTAPVETAKDVVNIAFKNTVAFFTELTKSTTNSSNKKDTKETTSKVNPLLWQHYKNTSVTHLARIKAFSITDVNIGGYHNIVNAASDLWGPSWRMIVDFAGGKPQCYGVYPGGQSGNPASKGFTEFIDKWAKGEYFKLHFYANKEEAEKGINKKK